MAKPGRWIVAVVAWHLSAFSALATRPFGSLRPGKVSMLGSSLLQLPVSDALTRVPSEQAVEAPLVPGSLSLVETSWHRWSPPPTLRVKGYEEFFYSAALFDWCVFSAFIALALVLRVVVLLFSPNRPGIGLLLSVLVAAGYFAAVYTQLGHQSGKDWLAGYVLELTFMVENIFIFSLITQSLRVLPETIPKALLFVVVGQILFELIFFMGLAVWLRSIPFLPYVLGVWLVCCGASCFCEGHDSHAADSVDGEVTFLVRMLQSISGRLSSCRHSKGGAVSDAHDSQNLVFVSLVVGVLLLADFFLEIDVVLMKIEIFPNGYIAFTSSAMAAVALPEMFALGEVFLHRFCYLKKGIAMVLIIFGLELLVSTFIKLTLPPMMSCLLIVAILGLSIILSTVSSRCSSKSTT